MKITRLEIKDRATLADVKADFADVNVIYGRNGTGKTLISEIFRAAENGCGIEPGTATVHLDNRRIIRSSEFTQGGLADRIRVFNRKFVEKNVFGPDPMAIVLGGDIKEQRDRADALQSEILGLESKLPGLQESVRKERASLNDLMVSRGQAIRKTLGPVARIDGAPPRWANFDKSDVDGVAKEIGNDTESFRRDDDRINIISETINEYSFPQLSEVTIPRPDSSRWIDETTELCATSLGTSLLDELSRDPQLVSWLEQGLALMGGGDECPFCQQDVPNQRIDQLHSHFTNAHRELGRRVDALADEISVWLSRTENPGFHDPEKLRANLRGGYEKSLGELQRMLSQHRESAKNLMDLLGKKRTDLSAVLTVDGSSEGWNEGTISQVNRLIRAHNAQGEVIDLGREYVEATVAAIKPELNRGESAIERLGREMASIEEEVAVKTREREVALRASRSEARAAAQLTELLAEFIGHREISVELNEDGSTFRLVRGGTKLIEPSEGEYNALGLMYFLMRLEDDRFEPAGSIVVFDDPITSFDDQRMIDAVTKILYRAGIKERRDRRVGQIFFFTHHLGLLDRLWRELKQRKTVRYFAMKSSRQSAGSDRTTSIEEVRTPTRFRYHVAFEEVYDMAVHSKPVNNPGNSIRLCIEGFLFSMTPFTFEDAKNLSTPLDQLYRRDGRENISQEEIYALCRVANAGSHDDLPDRPVNDADELAKFQGAAQKLLQLIKEVEPMHYEDMVDGVKKHRAQ